MTQLETIKDAVKQHNLVPFTARRLISPQQQLALQQQQLAQLKQRLQTSMQQQLQRQQQQLSRLQSGLQHLNPEGVLLRGYALVQNSAGEIVRDSQQLATGETLQLRLAKGSAEVEVKTKQD